MPGVPVAALLSAARTPVVPGPIAELQPAVLQFDSTGSEVKTEEKARSQRMWAQAGRHHRTLPDSPIPPVPASASASFPDAALLSAAFARETPDSGTGPGHSDQRRFASSFPARRGRGFRSWSITFPCFSVRGSRRCSRHGTDFHPPVLGPGFRIDVGYCRVVRTKGGSEYPVIGQAKLCEGSGNRQGPLSRQAPVVLITIARMHRQVVGESAHHQQFIVLFQVGL